MNKDEQYELAAEAGDSLDSHRGYQEETWDKFFAKVKTVHNTIVWEPQKQGEAVYGIYVGFRKFPSSYNMDNKVTMVYLQNKEGTGRTGVWLNAVLTDQLRSEKTEIGDLVHITFDGKKKGKAGSYNTFTTVVMHGDGK